MWNTPLEFVCLSLRAWVLVDQAPRYQAIPPTPPQPPPPLLPLQPAPVACTAPCSPPAGPEAPASAPPTPPTSPAPSVPAPLGRRRRWAGGCCRHGNKGIQRPRLCCRAGCFMGRPWAEQVVKTCSFTLLFMKLGGVSQRFKVKLNSKFYLNIMASHL